MTDDPYADRKALSFAQAEGTEPLPAQLALKELSRELRAKLWVAIYESLKQDISYPSTGGHGYFQERWKSVLYRKHVIFDHNMADDFANRADKLIASMRTTIEHGTYDRVLNLVQWLLRQPERVVSSRHIAAALSTSRAAYRLLEDNQTIVPITSDAEIATLNRAINSLAASPYDGARTHLRAAAETLTSGSASDSIRESMHAVESVARVIAGEKSLASALRKIKEQHGLHEALQRGFAAIYGFTSDEKGIRHPLLDDGTSHVDEADAIFMLGACSAFVTYLIARASPTQ